MSKLRRRQRDAGSHLSDDSGDRYTVHYSGAIAERFLRLSERAADVGRDEEFNAEVEQMLSRLAENPLGWGDPLRRYRHLGWLLCRGMGEHFVVEHAIDEGRKVVYLKDVRPTPWSGLGGAE